MLCKETAQEQIREFTASWGLYDAKAIISGGEESSIPEEMSDTLLAGVMTGVVEISEGGKTITHNLDEPVKISADEEVSSLKYKRMKIRKHHLTAMAELPQEDQLFALAQLISDAPKLVMSEMTTRDMGITMALTTYISFT